MATLPPPSATVSHSSEEQVHHPDTQNQPLSSEHENQESQSSHGECRRQHRHASPAESVNTQSSSGNVDMSLLGVMVPVHRIFLSDVPEDLRCPICYDGAANCRTRCGHSFCLTCINHHIATKMRQQQPTACPMCRSTEAGNGLLPISKEKQDKLGTLRACCLGHLSGCTVRGALSAVEAHEAQCPLVLLFCRFRERGCSLPVLRKDAIHHERRCRYNPLVRCCAHHISGCKVRGTAELLAMHEPRCRFRNMQKFVSCLHQALGCGLRIRKHYRERHAKCCAFKIIHDMKMRKQQQEERDALGQSPPASEAQSATSCDNNGRPATAEDSPQMQTQQTNEMQQQREELVDLSVSLQWGGTRELHTALLLPLLSRLLPNVSGVKEGRFAGEFDVILKQ